ncbi:MAG: hypothetical protein IJO00_00985, partial [Clostridia bacterium]|nr:hypothetical protein [Clostridia bacterium]
YAKICVKNRLISVIRKNRTEKKHKAKAAKPRDAVSSRQSTFLTEEIKAVAEKLLTKYEKIVFYMYLDGKSYRDIALSLGKTEKSVDNALFRAKKKFRCGYDI